MGCYPSKNQNIIRTRNQNIIRTLLEYKTMWDLQKSSFNGCPPDNIQQGGNGLDRDKVERNERNIYPANVMARIESTINGKICSGSGSFIAKNIILTCAHIFVKRVVEESRSRVVEASSVSIFVPDGKKQKNYEVLQYWYNPLYIQSQNSSQKFDYGIIILKETLNNGYLGIIQNWQPKQSQEVINMSFPVVIEGKRNKNQQKEFDLYRTNNARISNQDEDFYKYQFSTSQGASGSPLFLKTSQNNYQIVGIHISTSPNQTINRGLKFTKQMKQQINKIVSKNVFKEVFIKQQINNTNISGIIKQLIAHTTLALILKLIIADPKGNLKLQLQDQGLKHLSDLPFQNLKVLTLTNNQILMIPQLGNGFKSLNELNITNNHIRTISNLDAMPQLKILYLNNNSIKKMQNLAPLKKLKRLSIINNQVTTIENIEKLEKLQYLNLNENNIHELGNLQIIKQLRDKHKLFKRPSSVYLGGNFISDGIRNNKIQCEKISFLDSLGITISY